MLCMPERGQARIGLMFAGAPAVPEMVRLARRAEEAGYESVWMAETRMTRDGFVPLAAMAMATETIKLGTGIVNVYTRGAAVMALSFATLAELAPGRTIVGLGAGSPMVLAPQGFAWKRPLGRLREYVDVMRPLLRGEAVSYTGDAVTLVDARIEDVLAEPTSDSNDPDQLPFYLGVTGQKAVELAGEVADGTFYNVCLPTQYVARAGGWLATGAARADRQSSPIDVAMAILTSPDRDSATGKARAHEFVSLYLSLFPNIARETGVDEAIVTRTRAAFEEGGVAAAMEQMPLEIVDRLCAAGTPDECQARIDEYRAAGVQLPILIALGDSIGLAVDTLR